MARITVADGHGRWRDRRAELVPTLVRRRATLAANCAVVCGITVGRHAFVAAGAG